MESEDIINNDLTTKLSAITEEKEFEEVYKIANVPEIGIEGESTQVSIEYKKNTQQVVIPFRLIARSMKSRGRNNGFSDGIPDGYTLAKMVDGKYEKTGATDIFAPNVILHSGQVHKITT